MNAICLVVDRLHAGYLGAYGNTWIETPALDRFASRSAVFDRALVDSPSLERLYRSYWQGWHAMCPPPPSTRSTLPALLRSAGVTTALLTDDPTVAQHPLACDFDELIEIEPAWQPKTAHEVEQTQFARCLVETIDWLENARGPFLLWLHLGGLNATWDAPLRFREKYCEEGDPPPPPMAEVPDRRLPADYDPDELLGIRQAYSGQVTLLDTCLDALIDFLDTLPVAQESLMTLTSSRGFPLGEHLRVGACDDALYGELVQVPWMMRFPEEVETTMRSSALIEPSDLWATLLDWWDVEPPPFSPTAVSLLPVVREHATIARDRLCVLGSHSDRAIRTPAWYLRECEPTTDLPDASNDASDEGDADVALNAGSPELFAKPDDRWEVNNVATRCHAVVDDLRTVLAEYEQALPKDRVDSLPPLNEVLRHGME
jgi:arylsulfatase A-like enzyme